MSRTRSWMSKQPTRISVERGRLDAVLLDRPAYDGVETDVGGVHAAEAPHLGAVLRAAAPAARRLEYRAARRPSNMSGGSTTWSSTLTSTMSSSKHGALRKVAACHVEPHLKGPFSDTRVKVHTIVAPVSEDPMAAPR